MKHNKFFRFGGTVTAAVMLLSQVAAMPGSAAAPAPKDIDACDYVLETDGKKVERDVPVECRVYILRRNKKYRQGIGMLSAADE